MKIMVSFFIVFTLLSCAHHHQKPKHHHHAYEKMCAYDVLEGNYKTHGNKEFKLNHSGVTYYFSSKDKMDKFKKEIKVNVVKADTNWKGFSSDRDRDLDRGKP